MPSNPGSITSSTTTSGRWALNCSTALGPSVGLDDVDAVGLEIAAHDLADRALVVDDQNQRCIASCAILTRRSAVPWGRRSDDGPGRDGPLARLVAHAIDRGGRGGGDRACRAPVPSRAWVRSPRAVRPAARSAGRSAGRCRCGSCICSRSQSGSSNRCRGRGRCRGRPGRRPPALRAPALPASHHR